MESDDDLFIYYLTQLVNLNNNEKIILDERIRTDNYYNLENDIQNYNTVFDLYKESIIILIDKEKIDLSNIYPYLETYKINNKSIYILYFEEIFKKYNDTINKLLEDIIEINNNTEKIDIIIGDIYNIRYYEKILDNLIVKLFNQNIKEYEDRKNKNNEVIDALLNNQLSLLETLNNQFDLILKKPINQLIKVDLEKYKERFDNQFYSYDLIINKLLNINDNFNEKYESIISQHQELLDEYKKFIETINNRDENFQKTYNYINSIIIQNRENITAISKEIKTMPSLNIKNKLNTQIEDLKKLQSSVITKSNDYTDEQKMKLQELNNYIKEISNEYDKLNLEIEQKIQDKDRSIQEIINLSNFFEEESISKLLRTYDSIIKEYNLNIIKNVNNINTLDDLYEYKTSLDNIKKSIKELDANYKQIKDELIKNYSSIDVKIMSLYKNNKLLLSNEDTAKVENLNKIYKVFINLIKFFADVSSDRSRLNATIILQDINNKLIEIENRRLQIEKQNRINQIQQQINQQNANDLTSINNNTDFTKRLYDINPIDNPYFNFIATSKEQTTQLQDLYRTGFNYYNQPTQDDAQYDNTQQIDNNTIINNSLPRTTSITYNNQNYILNFNYVNENIAQNNPQDNYKFNKHIFRSNASIVFNYLNNNFNNNFLDLRQSNGQNFRNITLVDGQNIVFNTSLYYFLYYYFRKQNNYDYYYNNVNNNINYYYNNFYNIRDSNFLNDNSFKTQFYDNLSSGDRGQWTNDMFERILPFVFSDQGLTNNLFIIIRAGKQLRIQHKYRNVLIVTTPCKYYNVNTLNNCNEQPLNKNESDDLFLAYLLYSLKQNNQNNIRTLSGDDFKWTKFQGQGQNVNQLNNPTGYNNISLANKIKNVYLNKTYLEYNDDDNGQLSLYSFNYQNNNQYNNRQILFKTIYTNSHNNLLNKY